MTRISPTRMAVLCVLTLALVLTAVPAYAAAPNPTVSGTLSGTDGAAIAGGQVVVSHQVKGVWKPMLTISTSNAGTWSFTAKPDTYQIEFSAPFADPAIRLVTTVRGTNPVVDVVLQAYGELSGTITEAGTGAGIGGAAIELYRRNADGTWQGTPQVTTTTNGSGGYSFASLPCGAYAVKAAASSCVAAFFGGESIGSATPVLVTRGGSASATFSLQSLGEISGTVSDSVSGLPIDGASVELYRANGDGTWSSVKIVTSAPDGAYSSGAVPTGTWAAKATASGHVDTFFGGGSTPETAGQIAVTRGGTSEANIGLPPVPTGPSTIRGHVSRGVLQIAVGNAAVFVFKQRADGTWPTSFTPGNEYEMVFTDYLGNYVTSVPLTLGNYKVRFFSYHGVFPAEWYDHVATISEATTLTVGYEGQSYTGIDAWVNRTAP